MTYTVKARETYCEDKVLRDADVTVTDGRIAAVGAETAGEIIDCSAWRLLPGLIDMHVHGGNGVDVMDATDEALNNLSSYKLREGVTAFCPTTLTMPLEAIYSAIDAVKRAMKNAPGAKVLGAFLEGPYLDPKYKGAHPEGSIRDIALDEIKELVTYGDGAVTSIAIAPDKANAMEAIALVESLGVKARIGHSSAPYAQAKQAIDAGARIAIHTFNAMSPLNHREPGMVGAILGDDRIFGEVIADFVHIHPACVDLVIKAKGVDKTVLITDCSRAGGLPDGEYVLGELPIRVINSVARTMEGALASSTIGLMTAVKNVHQSLGYHLRDAVNMASLQPARALGLDKALGSIAPGKQADLVAIDDDFNVKFVMVDGKPFFAPFC